MTRKTKPWIILIAALVLGAMVLGDLAPALGQSSERFDVAQVVKKKRKTLMDLLFGDKEEPAPVQQPQQQQPKQPKKPKSSGGQQPTANVPPPKPSVEKSPKATRIGVFGDSLAVDLSDAIERFYAEDPNLVVVPKGQGSSGFVRDDFYDWNTAIAQEIAANSFDIAVVMIGINDLQDLSEGGKVFEPLSEGWKAAYTGRIARFLNALRSAGKPVIWIGLPPMSKSNYSNGLAQINAIQRLASVSGGAEFLDIYERFLGEDGAYTSYGPDVNGQNVRMRRDDGIHFTAAGDDKLAFYLSQPIKTFYSGGGLIVAIADPLQGTDAQAMLRLPYQGQGPIRQLEVAGAVVSLTNAPSRAMDLLTASAQTEAQPAFTLKDLVEAPIGRVDAFGVGIAPQEDEAVD